MEDKTVKFSDGKNEITVIFCGDSGEVHSNLRDGVTEENKDFDLACHVLESFILTAACAGVDIETPQFRETVSQMLDVIGNQYGE